MRKIITFGTFDVLHIGHIRILKRAREHGDHLIVGLSSDELNFNKKGRNPIYSFQSREELLSSMRFVDEVFKEESLEQKREYILKYNADVLVMGDDWAGKFDEFKIGGGGGGKWVLMKVRGWGMRRRGVKGAASGQGGCGWSRQGRVRHSC